MMQCFGGPTKKVKYYFKAEKAPERSCEEAYDNFYGKWIIPNLTKETVFKPSCYTKALAKWLSLKV